MIRNYIKTAFRSLLKNKGFTIINVLGLALGLATCLLIVFYVFDELNYDTYNTKADRIYRLTDEIKFAGNDNMYAVAQAPAAAALKEDFPEIEQVARFRSWGGNLVKKGNQDIREESMIYADPAIFDIFTLPMVDGNPATALKEPDCLVITESTAKKYFGRTNVTGQTLTFNDNTLYKITGVIKDIPKQSHFNFDFFISMPTLDESRQVTWLSNNFNTYILLKPGTGYKKLNAKLPGFLNKHMAEQMQSMLHLTIEQFEKSGNFFKMSLTPLKKIHLYSNAVAELGANGNIQYVYIFSAVAILILLIACVNFMNLSTARSANRAREVGVRKVLGSQRKHLIAQFLTESIIVTLVGATIAVFLAWGMLHQFNQMSGKELTVTTQTISWLLPAMIIIILVVGCLAGSYPALYLSGFQPIEVLKGKLVTGFKGGLFRSFLVIFQFFISIFLIISTLVIYNQLKYIQNKNLGYNRNHIINIGDISGLGDKAEVFKQKVKQLTGVENASLSEALPTWNYSNGTVLSRDAIIDQKRALSTQDWGVDEDFINTLQIKMAAGRSFSSQMATDSAALILNESAIKQLGLSNPVNQILYMPQDNLAKIMKPYHIIGVMKDFNYKSLRDNVTPLVFKMSTFSSAFSIRINSDHIPALLDQIKGIWKELLPNQQFAYTFMDQDFDHQYRSEQRIGTIFISFTTLAIIIACLGLFGLAAYAAEQRTKEIGIRKVLGANISTIVKMLSIDFLKLVLIAIPFAWLLGYFAMNKLFLQNFAYRQDIQWWILAVAGLGAIIIAFVTVSFQSVKAALTNPVKSLRSE